MVIELKPQIVDPNQCKYRGCTDDATGRGYCGKHRHKLTGRELKRAMRLPLKDKVHATRLLIRARVRQYRDKIYVAWSGGKDSTLVLWFARQEYRRVPVIFNNTTNEFPDTLKFIRGLAKEWELNFIENKPIVNPATGKPWNFWQIVKEYGWPYVRRNPSMTGHRKGSNVPKCCTYLKEYPARDLVRERGFEACMDGISAAESHNRNHVIRRKGKCFVTTWHGIENFRIVRPLWNWTEKDVWKFTKENDIPYNPVYDKG